MRRTLKDSPNPLQQLVKRHEEFQLNIGITKTPAFREIQVDKFHQGGPLVDGVVGPQFQEAIFENFRIKNKAPNNCFITRQNTIHIALNFAEDAITHRRKIICTPFNTLVDLYDTPRRSSSLNIFKASNIGEMSAIDVNEVAGKCVCLTYSDDQTWAIFPMLHCT
jgi:hypothetical protein